MKVALVHNVLAGGGLRRMREQASRLDAEVMEFCLAGAAHVTDAARVTPFGAWAPRAPRVTRPPLRYADVVRLERAWRRLAAEVERSGADVVLANSCHILQAPLALLSVRRPTVYFCDEPRRIDYEPAAVATRNPRTRGVYGPLYAWERRLDRSATAVADLVVANSDYGAAQISRAYGRPVATVPMGVAAFFHPAGESGRSHILSVGTLIPDKGHELVIEACALAGADRPVVIVSPRPAPEEAGRLSRLAISRGVDLTVRVGITDEELRAAYRDAFATVYLARGEPFGLASVEAQACGSPVIVSNEGGLPETLGGGGGGWAVPRSSEAAAERLRALEDASLWERTSAGARRIADERSWERSAALLHDVLEKASESSPSSPRAVHGR